MSYTVANVTGAAPATGNTGGLIVNCWDGNRFSPVNTPPATNGSPPSGSPDAGPLTTASYDAAGSWVFAVSTPDQWIISFYDPTDTSNGGSYNTYWLGPYLINASTNQQIWTSANSYTNRPISSTTTIASGSNGQTLPQGTINVASTANFTSTGYILIWHLAGAGTGNLVAYTGTSGGTQFTGCTGGTLTMSTGDYVMQGYLNSNYRRLAAVSITALVAANNDYAYAQAFSQIGGAIVLIGTSGISGWKLAAANTQVDGVLTFPVDPQGGYGISGFSFGTGACGSNRWTEVDF